MTNLGVDGVLKSKSITLLIVALLGIVLCAFVGYHAIFGIEKTVIGNDKGGAAQTEFDKRVSILLVGADQRPEQTKYNTDSLILAGVDPQTKRVSLLSIPRDTRIFLSGKGYVKINSVAALADFAALQKSVEELTGEKVTGYIQTNFQGFKQVIDTLGGITVNVEKDMYYETGDLEDGYINLHKGEQRLNGSKALQYARFRHDALADISRTARQQVVLKAIAKEMFQISTLPKLPVLIPQLMQAVHTNLTVKDILALSEMVVGFQSANVVSQTLPGSFLDLDGVSYWEVNSLEAKNVVKNLFEGVTTDKVIGQEKVDLLKPVAKAPKDILPKVPGNSQDPNGQDSSGYQKFQSIPSNDSENGA